MGFHAILLRVESEKKRLGKSHAFILNAIVTHRAQRIIYCPIVAADIATIKNEKKGERDKERERFRGATMAFHHRNTKRERWRMLLFVVTYGTVKLS